MTKRNDGVNSGFLAITPSDVTELSLVGIHVGGAGVVSVTDSLGVTTSITAAAGQRIDGLIRRVNATSTTATLIVGLVA